MVAMSSDELHPSIAGSDIRITDELTCVATNALVTSATYMVAMSSDELLPSIAGSGIRITNELTCIATNALVTSTTFMGESRG